MAKCPKCNADIPLKLSSQLKCSACNSKLVIDFSPFGRAAALCIILVECIASMTVSVVAGSIPYPFFQKWAIAGMILLALIIITLLLLLGVMNKMASIRLK